MKVKEKITNKGCAYYCISRIPGEEGEPYCCLNVASCENCEAHRDRPEKDYNCQGCLYAKWDESFPGDPAATIICDCPPDGECPKGYENPNRSV